MPFVRLACRGKLPSAPLFPNLDGHRVYRAHDAVCEALGDEFAGYRFHDARRTFGIAALKNGGSYDAVARVLGHKDTRLVMTTYGKYVPDLDAMRACDPSQKSRTATTNESAESAGA